MKSTTSEKFPPSRSGRERLLRGALLFLAGILTSAPALAAGPSVYPELSSIKVRPNAASKPAGTAKIAAARNEFEAFQVVVNGGTEGVGDLRASASALVGPGGATIPASSIWLYRVDLLNVTTKSGGIGTTGWWPDPLVPAVDPVDGQARNAFPFAVKANESRAIWVDVFVPRDARPGLYSGSISLSGSGFSAQVPVELEVWDFELPSTPSLATAFLAWTPNICTAHTGRSDCGGVATAAELAAKYQRLALDHRLTLSNVWVGRDHTSDWATFDRYFGPYLDGSAPTRLAGAKMTSAQITGSRSESAYRAWAQHFKSKGWIARLYDYTADEPPYGSSFDDIPPRVAMDRAADPAIRSLVTTTIEGATVYNVLDLLDILVPVINHIHFTDKGDQRPLYDDFIAGGGEVWMYQSCMSHGCSVGGTPSQGGSYPSYMVDVSATRNRLMQWADYRYRIAGELYYETVLAFSKDPWSSVFEFSGNGDGTLFYPGTPSKIGGSSQVPAESIRLKMIREGIEDYEYLTLLAKAGDKALADQAARSVLPTAYQASNEPTELLAAREQVARRIVELTASTPPRPDGSEDPSTEPGDDPGDDPGTEPPSGPGGPNADPSDGKPPATPGSDSVDGGGQSRGGCSTAGAPARLLPTAMAFAGALAALRRRRRR